jgi:FtsP/CotA-like multicopper oxidase with cupredoxin domain
MLSFPRIKRNLWLTTVGATVFGAAGAFAQQPPREECPRPASGSAVAAPKDLRSTSGVLEVRLTYRSSVDPSGQTRYCYLDEHGNQAPTLRVHPGDEVRLELKNEATTSASSKAMAAHGAAKPEDCTSGSMTATSTNLHFHGLMIPPTCHQDDVLTTTVDAGDPPFEYKFQIPSSQPPGLYWYHPHVHGLTKEQVLGGASGALIVEGIESMVPDVAGLPERVLIVRDQNLINPDAVPAGGPASIPPVILDRDGDAVNTGTGTGKPAKDLSLNFVPVPYPDYPPAIIQMRPGERQLWRVLNASAITYLNLQVVFNGVVQSVGVVGLDGVPLAENGLGGSEVLWLSHLGVPPGGRVEFIMNGPQLGTKAELVTRSVNTGPIGENDPARPLAKIVALSDASDSTSTLSANPPPLKVPSEKWLGKLEPVRTRRMYFSEKPKDPKDPAGPADFYMTLEGEQPKLFDPSSSTPNIVVHQGDVEDWIIENRSQEVHAFHIHQVHFLLLAWYGLATNEPYLRDTVNVPFWDGKSKYPTVKIRMDFRDPNIVGTFVYHCHVLEHEDGGMMGLIRVEPSESATAHPSDAPAHP